MISQKVLGLLHLQERAGIAVFASQNGIAQQKNFDYSGAPVWHLCCRRVGRY